MYEKFYGFSECPFGITPDPRFLYMAPGHFEAFSSMLSGVKEGKGITVVTGEVGVGKTTLIHALLKDLDEKIKVSFVFFSSLTFPQLLKQVLRDLGQPADETDLYGLLQSFHRYLSERLANDDKVAIIIDEAHVLEVEVLRDVARLVSRPNPSSDILRIILVGQPEFEEKLNKEELKGLRDVVSLHRRIGALDLAESKAYIDYRLRVAGSRTNSVFAPEAVERICSFAHGIPRVINLVCDAALVDGYSRLTKRIEGRTVKEVIKDLSHLETGPPRRRRKKAPQAVTLGRGRSRSRSLVISGATVASSLIVVLSLLGVSHIREGVPVKGPAQAERPYRIGVEANPGAEGAAARPFPTITAARGSSLIQLTRRHYGRTSPTILDIVLEANPSITNINLIQVRQRIVMPPLAEDSFVLRGHDNRYMVHLGTYVYKPLMKVFEDEPVLKGNTIEIMARTVSPRETWYRVVAKPFTTREEGVKTLSVLRGKGLLPELSATNVLERRDAF